MMRIVKSLKIVYWLQISLPALKPLFIHWEVERKSLIELVNGYMRK